MHRPPATVRGSSSSYSDSLCGISRHTEFDAAVAEDDNVIALHPTVDVSQTVQENEPLANLIHVKICVRRKANECC